MKVNIGKVRMFKIRNRKGYACACLNHLTEGKTVVQAYCRMQKALRRSGAVLQELDSQRLKKLVIKS